MGSDYLLDQDIFLPYDAKASLAHAKMLFKCGFLNAAEFKNIEKGLAEILNLWKKGKFRISQEQEDCHTAIEQYLTEKYGAAGQKIHTGRSRNDQSLVMIRLYEIAQMKKIMKLCESLAEAWTGWIKSVGKTPMPGYTHMQKAMPTTVGAWQESYKNALEDSVALTETATRLLDQSPLGSGAGYGIPLNIDREITARELGFKKVQLNPIYCQLSRGLFEAQTLSAASFIMTILSRWASDLLLFTTSEFDYFSLPAQFCTGSSIMPQKKNCDVFEIMRANSVVVQAAQFEVQQISGRLYCGYHRDLQLIKPPLVRGISAMIDTLETALALAPRLQINKKKLAAAMTPELFATAKVYDNVKKGVAFRKAYNKVKRSMRNSQNFA